MCYIEINNNIKLVFNIIFISLGDVKIKALNKERTTVIVNERPLFLYKFLNLKIP